MRKTVLVLVAWALVVGFCSHASATAYWVATSGNDNTGNGSFGSPYRTIAKGIAVATNNDTVLIASGTYTGDGNRNVHFRGKGIVVRSATNNPADVIIDCGGSPNRGFVFDSSETSASILYAVTIQNGDVRTRYENFAPDMDGGGIKIYSSPVIRNCIISGCRALGAGGIQIWNNTVSIYPTIDGCTFTYDSTNVDNASLYGGAIKCVGKARATIQNCTFAYNVAPWGGGAILVACPGQTITYCSFYQNKAGYDASGWAGAIRIEDTTTIQNCTFVANIAARGGAIYAKPGSKVTFQRNIVAFHSCSGVLDSTAGKMSYACCDFFSNAGGSIVGSSDTTAVDANTVFADPLFCDLSGGNLHISSYSPCDEDSAKCRQLVGRFDNACNRCCKKAGDVNNSGSIGLVDLSALDNYLSGGGYVPPCLQQADVNGDGSVNLSDLSALTSYLTNGSPTPSCPPQNS